MRVYEWAQIWAIHGYSVVPVQYRTKKQIKAKISDYHDRLPTSTELLRWFGGGNQHNYGVVLRNGLTVFDFDSMKSWYEWYMWSLGQEDGSDADILASQALCVKTSNGVHLWFELAEQMSSRRIDSKDFDLKRASVCTGPGSTHPSGAVYEATNDFSLPKIETLESILPPEWYELLHREPEITQGASCGHVGLSDDPFDMATNPIEQGVSKIDWIRENVTIQSLLSNVTRATDGFLMAECPLPEHGEDNSPSMWINTKLGICNCNKCQRAKPMDVINLYGIMNGVTDAEAIRTLAN